MFGTTLSGLGASHTGPEGFLSGKHSDGPSGVAFEQYWATESDARPSNTVSVYINA